MKQNKIILGLIAFALFQQVTVTAEEEVTTRKGKKGSFVQRVEDGLADCEDGCGLDDKIFGDEVCGINGLTYQNECFAYCQGIEIVNEGSCAEDGPGVKPVKNKKTFVDDDSEIIPLSILNQYSSEGFSLIAMRTFASVPLDESGETKKGKVAVDIIPQPPRAVRITPAGYEYASNEALTESVAHEDSFSDEGERQRRWLRSHENDERDMKVIGSDSRYEVSANEGWPLRLVGKLEGSGTTGCTGTVISETSIVTSATCVYSLTEGTYKLLDKFIPGLSGNTEPFGNFPIESVTTYQNYVNGEGNQWNLAVVTLGRGSTESKRVGQVAGYAGVIFSNTTNSRNSGARIVGFPNDRGWNGNTMVNAGNCGREMELLLDNSSMVSYTCDTEGAMAGAGLMDRQGYLYGVHYGFAADADFNLGNLLNYMHYDNIFAWSDRRSNPGRQSPECGVLGLNLFCFLFDPGACGAFDEVFGFCERYGSD